MSPTPRPALLLPLLRQTYEVWSLESNWFLFYGFFMLVAAYAAGQLPVLGLPLSLALEGPLAAGLILATRRVLLEERPGVEDFMGGFRGAQRLTLLALLSLLVSTLVLAGVLLLIVPGILLASLWAVALPALMLEGGGLLDCLRTSVALTRPRLGLVAVLVVAQGLIQLLLALPMARVVLAQGQPTLAQILPFLLGLGLLGPIHGILNTLLYLRLKEEAGHTLARG
ncbi:MAG: hypothetical protein Q8O14_06130 [bacterium]|nr:hypothetical protein [bacterium]